MNDKQLDDLLRTAKVPKKSKKYEAEFPQKVMAALKNDPHVAFPQPETKSKRLTKSRPKL
jgi:hypothetical protein